MARVTFEPDHQKVEVVAGASVLEASRAAGIELQAACGGLGICDTCRVRLLSGSLSRPDTVELDALAQDEIDEGFRLACQAQVVSDATIEVPPDVRAADRRLVVEGRLAMPEADRTIDVVDLKVDVRLRGELVPALERLMAATGVGQPLVADPAVAKASIETLERGSGRGRAVLVGEKEANRLLGVVSERGGPLGLAIDLGSTRLAGYLVDLEAMTLVAKSGAANPQIPYGEDVVSRIAYANMAAEHARTLQSVMLERIERLLDELCRDAGRSRAEILDVVVVGNTAMHHLVLGWPVRQLGEAPYVPMASLPFRCRARDLGLDLQPGAMLYLPPLIAGFVGSDHVAVQSALALDVAKRTTLAVDIGTNTEVSLSVDGTVWCCSCASGPAFEGAHISRGMRAAPGAIDRVWVEGDELEVQTIGAAPAIGICGSGIVDAVASMKRAGFLSQTGRFTEVPEAHRPAGGDGYLLVAENATGNGRAITVTRRDVHEIQLAKGAIRAGVDVLLSEAGISPEAVERVVLAGAFGSFLDTESVTEIGMLPRFEQARIDQVGNAAGVGAVHMLLSEASRRRAEHLARHSRYIELTIHPRFSDFYLDALLL